MSEPTNNLKPLNPKSPDHPHWDGEHRVNLQNFLTSETGQLALEWLKYWAPLLLDGSDVNRTLVASGEVKGYTGAVENLFSLVRYNPVPETPAAEQYPNLDDDAKWDSKDNKRD